VNFDSNLEDPRAGKQFRKLRRRLENLIHNGYITYLERRWRMGII
jgi:hypothetical protein